MAETNKSNPENNDSKHVKGIKQKLSQIKAFFKRSWVSFKVNLYKLSRKVHELESSIERKGGKTTHIPFRLNFLFFIVFVLFFALIIQLSYVQLVNGDLFEAQIAMSNKQVMYGNTPRGMIYDSQGVTLVNNKAEQAVIYTKPSDISTFSLRKVADKLSEYVDVTSDKLSDRDKQDYYLADEDHYNEIKNQLTESEKSNDDELYSIMVDKVTPEEIAFSEDELKAASIFKKMNGAYTLGQVYIKSEGLTNEEIALVGEHQTELEGVSIGADWTRDYPLGDTLRSILGTVSTEAAGIPADEENYYLSLGYAANDRVGLSYLEKQYESVLAGTKSQTEISEIVGEDGNYLPTSSVVYSGEKGKNLLLTIDSEFQKGVEEILKKYYQSEVDNGVAKYSPGAYAVALDPKNGDVLAMAGFSHDLETNEIKEDVLGTINKAFIPGSSIKGATIMAGFKANVLDGNTTLIDQPLVFQDGTMKSSVFNRIVGNEVQVDTVKALEISSNVYMMDIVFRMLGIEYTPGMTLPIDTSPFAKLRSAYEEYGLGTSTGIDLPNESTGISNTNYTNDDGTIRTDIMGNLLDLSYGNYDTYTPMQMAQYISTIANGGSRIAPHIVKGIYANADDGSLGGLEYTITPKVLNQVSATDEQINIVKEGMYNVVHGTDSRRTGRTLESAKYEVSAKTGTAETYVIPDAEKPEETINVINSTMVAFAPSDDPKIAVSVVLPQMLNASSDSHALITREIMDLYYDLYE